MRGEGNSGWAGYQARAAGARLAKEKKRGGGTWFLRLWFVAVLMR